jgi:hypothetical protein
MTGVKLSPAAQSAALSSYTAHSLRATGGKCHTPSPSRMCTSGFIAGQLKFIGDYPSGSHDHAPELRRVRLVYDSQ